MSLAGPVVGQVSGPVAGPVENPPCLQTVRRLLAGFSVLPDNRIELSPWSDGRVADIWLPDYQGVLTAIPGGMPVIVDRLTGRLPRVVGTYPDLAYYTTDASGNDLGGDWAFEHWPASTNLFLNASAPATQTITLTAAGDYTLSVQGAGSVTIAAGTASGSGWGTAVADAPVTINVTAAGTVTCTVSGAPDAVQLEQQTFATPFIPTSDAPATRDTCAIRAPYAGHFNQRRGVVYAEVEFGAAGVSIGNKGIVSLKYTGGVLYVGVTGNIQSTDGTKYPGYYGWIPAPGDLAHLCSRYRDGGTFQVGVRPSGDTTWAFGGKQPYDGAFPSNNSYVKLFYSMPARMRLRRIEILDADIGTDGIANRYSLAALGD